jgi:hypothetical protein
MVAEGTKIGLSGLIVVSVARRRRLKARDWRPPSRVSPILAAFSYYLASCSVVLFWPSASVVGCWLLSCCRCRLPVAAGLVGLHLAPLPYLPLVIA